MDGTVKVDLHLLQILVSKSVVMITIMGNSLVTTEILLLEMDVAQLAQ